MSNEQKNRDMSNEQKDNVVPLVPPETEQLLDAEEEEFRKLRRDLPGVKGTAAAGMINIAIGKIPGRNKFFRTHPDPNFQPVFNVVNEVSGMDKVFYAVAPGIEMPLASIGISFREYRMYFCQLAEGGLVVVPVPCPDEKGNRNDYDATRERGLREGIDRWVRLWADLPNNCYRVYPSDLDKEALAAVAARYPNKVVWPDLSAARVFRTLTFKAKGLLLDSVDHQTFLQWSARDRQ